MPKSDSAEILLASIVCPTTEGFVLTPGNEDIQTDMAISAVTAKASLGDGNQPQKPTRAGSAAMRARNDASNAGDGEIDGRSSSALHSARNSSVRERQEAQANRCSSTAWRSAGCARPSRYSTSLDSRDAQFFSLLPFPNIGPSLPSPYFPKGGQYNQPTPRIRRAARCGRRVLVPSSP